MVLIIMCRRSIKQFTFAVFETQQGSEHTGNRHIEKTKLKLCVTVSDCWTASAPACSSLENPAGVETVKQSDTVTHNFSSKAPNSCVLTALLSLNDSKCKLIK